jgi:hypothetical protein
MNHETRRKRSQWITGILTLVASAGYTLYSGMDAKDVVWGLWVSSFTAGYLLFFVRFFFTPSSHFRDRDHAGKPTWIIAFIVGFLLFGIIHNLIHEVLFMLFLALMPFTMGIEELARTEGAALDMVVRLYTTFWPLIVFTSISWIQAAFKESLTDSRGSLFLPMPTGYLMRLSITVFMLAICRIIADTVFPGFDRWIILPVLILVYLPFETLANRHEGQRDDS